MQEYNFDRQSMWGDWSFVYQVKVDGLTEWGPNDVILFGAKPDFAMWDDYGQRKIGPAGTGDLWAASYWINARSDDNSGMVALVAPNKVAFSVAGGSWRGCGPGTINLGARYLNTLTGQTIALWRARMPLVDGGV